jgi:glucokinase
VSILAIDIGGTKLAAGVVSEDGELVSAQVPTPDGNDAEALFEALIALVERVRAGTSAEAIGVGCGGPMRDDNELVSPLNIPAWRDFPLRSRLTEHFRLPAFVDNDAKALALGEGWMGAARGCENYIGMVVSTGIGGGIVLNGRLLDGADGNAGHIGHVIVEPGGTQCACGAHGCLEAEASGTAIRRLTGGDPKGAPAAVIARAGTLVGRGIASVANLLDIELAVVSGSVALGYGEPFFHAAQAEIDARCQLDFSRGTRVVPGALGADGPLIGAAAVALLRLND